MASDDDDGELVDGREVFERARATIRMYPEHFGPPPRHWFWRTWLGELIERVREAVWMWNWKRRFDKRPPDRRPPYRKMP